MKGNKGKLTELLPEQLNEVVGGSFYVYPEALEEYNKTFTEADYLPNASCPDCHGHRVVYTDSDTGLLVCLDCGLVDYG